MLALVSDEELNHITLLKNPHRYAASGSLANPSPIDNYMYGFTETDAWNLAAVYLLPLAFKKSALYNVLNKQCSSNSNQLGHITTRSVLPLA